MSRVRPSGPPRPTSSPRHSFGWCSARSVEPAPPGRSRRPRSRRRCTSSSSPQPVELGTGPDSHVYYWADRESASRGGGQMAGKDGIGKATEAARAARRNRYVQRLIEDEDVRENILAAYAAARSAYGRMDNGKPGTQA